MRKQWLPLMIVAAVLLVSPLRAGDEKEEKKYCTNKVEDCVRSMKEKFATRGWVGINMEASEEAGAETISAGVEEEVEKEGYSDEEPEIAEETPGQRVDG